MTWTSAWMPAWILAFFLLACLPPRRWQPGAMSALSCAFLAWADWRGLAAILGAGGVTWLLLRGSRPGWGRAGSAIALVVLAFVASKVRFQITDGVAGVAVLGFAFAAWRLIHVAMETALGRVTCPDGWEFFRYLLFFPTVIAGPLHRLDDLQRDENRRRWDPVLVAAGAERVLYGFFKIAVLGGWFTATVERQVWTMTWHPGAEAWFSCLCYGWNLYFQFSGYSDVAIGLALAAGHRVPENFNFPFLATNIQDFWQRWHASLSAWCRLYIAEPVLATTRNRWLATIAAMLVLGLWHELSLRYCAWGLFHGLGIAAYHHYSMWRGPGTTRSRLRIGIDWVIGVLLTQAFVIMSFAITSNTDLTSAWHMLLRMWFLEGR